VTGHFSLMLSYSISRVQGCNARNFSVGPQVGFILPLSLPPTLNHLC